MPAEWIRKVIAAVISVGCAVTFCAQAPRYTRTAAVADTGISKRTSGKSGSIPRQKRLPNRHFYQTGQASYYGDKFHGRKTASGERYDKNRFTAAHRTLPFGTMVSVTGLSSGKTVVVRINDRGPYKKNRIIDLSRAAARQIGMLAKGVLDVGIEIDIK